MAATVGEIVSRIIETLVFVGAFGFVVFMTVRQADDPARMVFKWILTAGIVGVIVWKVLPLVGRGGNEAAFVGVPFAAVCSLALALVWRHNLAALIAEPFASLYDGGSVPPEPRPVYSIAQARQKQGRYHEAIFEIHQQLERFPTDLEGHLLLAEIQAQNLHDLAGAELTIQNLCAQPGHAPANIAFALYSLADWHLQIAHDREAARRIFEQVMQLLPDSEFSLGAAQRVAHLGAPGSAWDDHERKFPVPEGIRRVGLLSDQTQLKSPEPDPARLAADYVKHLEAHPLDTEAREKLAVIYVEHYSRLDLATDQLEQMIGLTHQPNRLVARWLNLLADLQIRCGAGYDAVKQTLQRIIDLAPNFAAAETARKRIDLLRLEMKGLEKSKSVKLGTYEQNLGLKQSRGPNQKPGL